MHDPFRFIEDELKDLKEEGLYRSLRALELVSPVHGKLDGKLVTLFCTNDYLGLSFDPEMRSAYEKAVQAHGVGSGAARLISGTRPAHLQFEKEMAKFLGQEAALLFSSGYLANLGILSALVGSEDVIVMDKLSHASLIDAAKLSGARLRVYPHGNLKRLDEILSAEKGRRRKTIVTDSVFSMDGDKAPLKELVRLKKKHGAFLVLDEAHGFGVFGPGGRVAAESEGLLKEIDVYIGTLSKAAGLVGGFAAGSRELVEFLVNRARTFIYDTALPPGIPETALLALKKIQDPRLRTILWDNVKEVRELLSEEEGQPLGELSPIIPILIGDERKAVEVSKQLLSRGLFVPAVRYPTVPKGKARLRLTVSAAHTLEDIELLETGLNALL